MNRERLRRQRERERWDPHVRRDRLTEYRPPWHRAGAGDHMLVCLSADMFVQVTALCAALHIDGEDALEWLAFCEDAEREVVLARARSESVMRDYNEGVRLLNRRLDYGKDATWTP